MAAAGLRGLQIPIAGSFHYQLLSHQYQYQNVVYYQSSAVNLLSEQLTSSFLLPAASNHLLRFRLDFAVEVDKSPLLQFLDGRAGLARILGLENDFQLFKRDALCLHVEEIDEGELEQVPEDEEDVEPVADLCSRSVILLSLGLWGVMDTVQYLALRKRWMGSYKEGKGWNNVHL